MVDTTRASEGKYVNAEMVKNSPSKKLVIIDEGKYSAGTYGEQFQLTVEIDRKQKIWTPNTDCIKTMQATYGRDSALWVGKIVDLRVLISRGKETITCIPQEEPKILME